MRCDICKTTEFVDRLTKMCEKDPHTYSEMRHIAEYYEAHREISPLSADAVKHLMREKDPKVEAKALKTLGSQCEHGNKATAKQVKTVLSNIRERTPTKGGDHRGAVKPKGKVLPDLSGIYKPPALPEVSEDIPDKDEYQNDIDEEIEYTGAEEDEEVAPEDTSSIPDVEGDTVGGIPEIPEEDITEDVLAALEDKTVVIGTKDDEKTNEEDAEVDEANRIEMLNRAEERRADIEAEKIVVKCLNSILHMGYPRQKLSRLVENAVREIVIPDGGCPMPNSSTTKGGAITTNLGGR